jgi:hypothetical protein
MSVLEKRLQVLIDAARWERLEAESAQTGQSIGAIVRSSLDLHFSEAGTVRAAAAGRLLALPEDSALEWSATKQAMADEMAEKLG